MQTCSQIAEDLEPGTALPLLARPSPTLPYLLVFIFPRAERAGQARSCWKQNGSRNLAEKSKNICYPTGNFICPVFLNQVILLLTVLGNISGGSKHKPKLIQDQGTGHIAYTGFAFLAHCYLGYVVISQTLSWRRERKGIKWARDVKAEKKGKKWKSIKMNANYTKPSGKGRALLVAGSACLTFLAPCPTQHWQF